MRINGIVLYSIFLGLSVCQAQDKPSWHDRDQANKANRQYLRDHEVTFSAQVWGYSRVYPLLDGLLQDIAATQASPLVLGANAPNGTAIDAVQQSLQVQLQYSQMAGVQNAAAAQAATANSSYQSTLAQQETTLMQNLVTAYNQVATAQATLNSLTAAGASATDIANATQALQGANANLTAVTTAIGNFKNLASPTVPAPASPLATTPTLPPATGSVLPSGITGAVTNSTNPPPSFPATKQLDNQINILWDRVARLVQAMSRPDSMSPDDKIYLVKFDTGIFPLKRNKQVLDVSYSMSCGGVIDVFPRNAALNLVEDKYKDSAFGFGAVLNWFGVGGSVAYNREHLKASQLLGQSSYISGHGIGQQEFGWLYGITLGDDSISPGPRNTFALVWTPNSCKDPSIKVSSVKWSKPPKFKVGFPLTVTPANAAWTLTPKDAGTCASNCVTSIEFNRNEYDITAGKPFPVTVRITLSHEMDQQQTVSINGQFVQRVRDNFGRAISPTVTGTNGVLETSQMGVNTWIPTSPSTMLITVDSSLFGSEFPQILLSSPESVIDVLHDRAKDARIVVSGNTLSCATSPCALLSLGVPKSTPKNFGIARRINNQPMFAGKTLDQLCITVLDADTTPTPTGNATGGVPTVQVISDTNSQVWGSDTEVDVIDAAKMTISRLSCDPPLGSRLVCDAPDHQGDGDGNRPPIELQIVDAHHAGGTSIKGIVFTKQCKNDNIGSDESCRKPLIWKTSPPKLLDNRTSLLPDSKWRMWIQVVNVDDVDKATLGALSADSVAAGKMFNCSSGANEPCTASFTISLGQLGLLSNWMSFQVSDQNNKELGGPAVITNIFGNIKPVISQIADDRTNWFGRNLVFDSIRVGLSATFHVQCLPDGSQCRGDGKYGTTTGFMYFVVNPGLIFPFVQVNTSGVNTGITYTPPKPATTPTAPTKGGTTAQNLQAAPLVVPPSKALTMQALQ